MTQLKYFKNKKKKDKMMKMIVKPDWHYTISRMQFVACVFFSKFEQKNRLDF